MVTVTRDVRRSSLDLPFAISISRPDSLRPGQSHTLVDQTLFMLPGVTLSNRTNPSQDTRIAIRGFGARSAFGVRSIRVMRDGMPLSLPDGQTPLDYLDLESVGSVEAIRGTASALYGNASGGVIDVRTAPAPSAPVVAEGRAWFGSDGLMRDAALVGGSQGAGYYQANIGHTTSDNYRNFSRQRLSNAYLRGGLTVGGTDLTLQAMGLDMPLAENPGALTQAQLDNDPRLADPLSITRRARKEVEQIQTGLSARRSWRGSGELFAQAYGSVRDLYNPLTFAVVDVARRSGGAGVRMTIPANLRSWANRITLGADAQRQSDMRRNWAACNGVAATTANCPQLGVEQGVLQLQQREIVSSIGTYVRDEITVGVVSASVGLRADQVRFSVRDDFLSDGRDDSGTRTLSAVSPLVGIVARLSGGHAAYVNLATAFETPTTTELGNQPNGNAGLNRDLDPQLASTLELGLKGLAVDRLQYDVAVFDTRVRDELIPFEVPGGSGRTYYRNAGRTRRRGVEVQGATEFRALALAAAYTYSHFRFSEFQVGTSDFQGNRIPGVPEHAVQASATLSAKSAFVVTEVVAKSKVFANDANSASAPAYTIANVRVGATAVFGRPWISPVVGVQNLFDRHYVGSVAINATGASLAATKFYEPASGRTWLIGLSLGTRR